MKLFDCDVSYGRGCVALPKEIETPACLLAEMDHCGISEALVWHRDAFERDFASGNCRLDELRDTPRFHLTRTFVPAESPEVPSAEGFIDAMRTAGARAARAFPAHHCFLLNRVACGSILELLVAHSVPLLVPLNEFPRQWIDVYELLENFPTLTLILTFTGPWGQDRYCRPLMRKYERFYIATHQLKTAGQLEGLVNDFGPHQILFGSGLPRYYPGAFIMALARADIPSAARDAIAHGNIERLLSEVTW